jgi:class 3 adenylate cyclase
VETDGPANFDKTILPDEAETPAGAWLEATGEKIPIRGNCALGRSPKNCIVLDSQKISRRHAIINAQNIGEFWLIDLGSSNGTFLNNRRMHQPVRLCDQDQIVIGDRIFIFHQPEKISEDYRTTFVARTIREIENIPCWLLVGDIENFTPLSRSLTSDHLATLIGTWVATCKEIIETHEGMMDKYLGDGFLAYWRGDKSESKNVAEGLIKLKEAQVKNEPRFRIALHFGFVAIGGVPSMGEESLLGREVNFVFRMEKLAGALKLPILTSAAGQAKLKSLVKCEPAGAHELKGFEGTHEFYSC